MFLNTDPEVFQSHLQSVLQYFPTASSHCQ